MFDLQGRRVGDLVFSQRSLQDYADCPRRFQLRYLLCVAWPAVRVKPIEEMEERIRLGQRFHRMVHQYVLDIPAERLEAGLDDEELRRWWHNFLAAPPRDLPTGIRRAEVSLSASLADHRLTARYDLLAADPGGRLVIVDWKTGPRPKNTSRHLLDKFQTIVYPYVLVEAGAALNGGQPVQPEQVTMIYWFADSAGDPLTLAYDAARHAASHDRLVTLVGEIVAHSNKNVEIWPLTDSERTCKFCTYRSLCNRGSVAGDLDDLDDDLDVEEIDDIYDIYMEQVAEIAFQ